MDDSEVCIVEGRNLPTSCHASEIPSVAIAELDLHRQASSTIGDGN
ncbi:hypothetical protein [Synechococcus sp. PCC 7336]|nr:hypothetical protein [Synechococcus sp. PCC 7336]